jgi:hypothetical protein
MRIPARELAHIQPLADGSYVLSRSITERHVYAQIMRPDERFVVRRYLLDQLVEVK